MLVVYRSSLLQDSHLSSFGVRAMSHVYAEISKIYNNTLNQGADKGIARTQSPTNKNCAFELPTFGVIVGVSLAEVQWKGLALEEPPS